MAGGFVGEFFGIKKIKIIAGRLSSRTDFVVEGRMLLVRFTLSPTFHSRSARRGNRGLLHLLNPERVSPKVKTGTPDGDFFFIDLVHFAPNRA